MSKIVLFWHRRDLRIDDNAGLYKALTSGNEVLPLFIFDRNILSALPDADDARVTFIHQEVTRLSGEYAGEGSSLLVKYGTPVEVWKELIREHEIRAVYTNRDYEPYARERDQEICELLQENGIEFIGAKDHVIFEKSEVVKDDGTPYLVFTPYFRKWKENMRGDTFRSVPSEEHLGNLYKTSAYPLPSLEEMGFEQSSLSIPSRRIPSDIISGYDKTRDYPAESGTTRLGVHLRFGTVSIRELAREAKSKNDVYLKELIWRDFYQMVLYHFPESPDKAIKPDYDRIEWENNEKHFEAWCEGRTGYPMVDAGMRELNATGYMHNRVRMITASFLTKHLLIDWRWGERYFAQKLLDFELASNVGGWQWASGSGCDAAPYFRIFNPESQLQKFDEKHKYTGKWIPELGTPEYPEPIVDHKAARERALSRYKEALNTSG